MPQLLARCVQPLPEEITDAETLARNRHLDMLLHARPAELIELRSEITTFLRQWLSSEGHVEVQTPILADTAGGAVARPFVTSSSEFPERQIALRIAPELWLKRLILGGLERVFEIGPSFRNEGNFECSTTYEYSRVTTVKGSIEIIIPNSQPASSTGRTWTSKS